MLRGMLTRARALSSEAVVDDLGKGEEVGRSYGPGPESALVTCIRASQAYRNVSSLDPNCKTRIRKQNSTKSWDSSL